MKFVVEVVVVKFCEGKFFGDVVKECCVLLGGKCWVVVGVNEVVVMLVVLVVLSVDLKLLLV